MNDLTPPHWGKLPEGQQASGNVPEWAWRRVCELQDEAPTLCPLELLARYIAAHEPAPVDPLREVVAQAWDACHFADSTVDTLTAELRARGVTLTNAGTEPEGE